MTLFYALGGGLGHFTRSWAVSHTCGDALSPPYVFLVSPGVAETVTPALSADCTVRELPSLAVTDASLCRDWVEQEIALHSPDTIVMDCFAFGIFGELQSLLERLAPSVRLIHVARSMRRHPPVKTPSPCIFERVWTVEKLSETQQSFVQQLSKNMSPLELIYPPANRQLPKIPNEACLVVHSGSPEETAQLLELARQVAAPNQPIVQTDFYPAWQLFEKAGLLVTACGFNTMQQTKPWRKNTTICPCHVASMINRGDCCPKVISLTIVSRQGTPASTISLNGSSR